MKTTYMSNIPSKEWVHARKNYLGGSEVAAVLGKSAYTTPFQLWLVKTGRKEPQDNTPVTELGHILEPVVAEKFTRMTGLKLRNISDAYEHPQHPFLQGNIDRQIVTSDRHEGPGVLEIKTTTSYRLKHAAGAYPEEWDYQIQHYLMLTGYSYAYLAIFERDTGIFQKPIFIARNEPFIENNTRFIIDWWNRHIVEDDPPDPTTDEDMMILYPSAKENSVIEATPASYALYQQLQKIRSKISQLELEKDMLQVLLKEQIGDSERMVYRGDTLLTWKNQATNRLDAAAFKEQYPDLYRTFTKQTTTRRFTVK